MKRYPLYDPPEYMEWAPDEKVMAAYKKCLKGEEKKILDRLGRDGVEALYQGLVRNRLYDITLKRWVRTGVLTKAWLGQGEEASTIGAVHALGPEDVVGPMIRNAGACIERGIPLEDCLKVYLATGDTVTKGRDLHIGDLEHNVVCPVSLVGDLIPVLAGFALAFKKRNEDRVALTWTGEGATRTAACHEGLAMAAALSVPLIVMVQDNAVALGTRTGDSLRRSLRAMPQAYDVAGFECDGNHVLDVYRCVSKARELCLRGEGPVIINTSTFRMGGHATHDEREARELFSEEAFRDWGLRDPVACFEEYLKKSKILGSKPEEVLEKLEQSVVEEIDAAEKRALAARDAAPPDAGIMESEVYAE